MPETVLTEVAALGIVAPGTCTILQAKENRLRLDQDRVTQIGLALGTIISTNENKMSVQDFGSGEFEKPLYQYMSATEIRYMV